MNSSQKQICGQLSRKRSRKNSTISKIVHIDAKVKTATPLINTGVMAVICFIKCQRWDIILHASLCVNRKFDCFTDFFTTFLLVSFFCGICYLHLFFFDGRIPFVAQKAQSLCRCSRTAFLPFFPIQHLFHPFRRILSLSGFDQGSGNDAHHII